MGRPPERFPAQKPKSVMSTKSYLKRLQESSQDKEARNAGHESQKAKLALQADLLETRAGLAAKEQELENAKGAAPLDIGYIIELKDEVRDMRAAERILVDLDAELFPTTESAQG